MLCLQADNIRYTSSVRETCAATQKNVHSYFLDFEKKPKKRTYSFTGHLIITQLPKVGTVKTSASNTLLRKSEMRTLETMQHRTVCDKRLNSP